MCDIAVAVHDLQHVLDAQWHPPSDSEASSMEGDLYLLRRRALDSPETVGVDWVWIYMNPTV